MRVLWYIILLLLQLQSGLIFSFSEKSEQDLCGGISNQTQLSDNSEVQYRDLVSFFVFVQTTDEEENEDDDKEQHLTYGNNLPLSAAVIDAYSWSFAKWQSDICCCIFPPDFCTAFLLNTPIYIWLRNFRL